MVIALTGLTTSHCPQRIHWLRSIESRLSYSESVLPCTTRVEPAVRPSSSTASFHSLTGSVGTEWIGIRFSLLCCELHRKLRPP